MQNWVERLTGTTRGRLLRLLRTSPRTVGELSEDLGISGPAVRGHLSGLQRDGLVEEAGLERDTGGKPARRYRITAEAEELYPKAYAAVLGGLLDVLGERLSPREVRSLLDRVAAKVAPPTTAGPANGRDGEPEAAVARAARVVEGLGGEVRTERVEEGWELRGVGCPLSALVEEHPALCEMVRALLEEVSGRRVMERCDRSRSPRCAFVVGGGRS